MTTCHYSLMRRVLCLAVIVCLVKELLYVSLPLLAYIDMVGTLYSCYVILGF